MITKFKIFENTENIEMENIRCNNCFWYGHEPDKGFELNDENDELCPECGVGGMLMDITPIDLDKYPDFIDYMKSNKPLEGIKKYNYNNLEEYYKDAYPEYFTANKYNL